LFRSPGVLQRGRFGDGLVLVLHVAEEERGRGLLHARLAVRLQGVADAPRVRRRSLQRPLLARLPDLLLEGADAFAQLLRLDVGRLSLLGDARDRGAVAGLGRGQQLGVVLQAAAAVVRGRGRLGPLPLCLLVPRQQPGEARDVPPQALHLLRRPGRRGVIRRRGGRSPPLGAVAEPRGDGLKPPRPPRAPPGAAPPAARSRPPPPRPGRRPPPPPPPPPPPRGPPPPGGPRPPPAGGPRAPPPPPPPPPAPPPAEGAGLVPSGRP